jgi:hypothetical protein
MKYICAIGCAIFFLSATSLFASETGAAVVYAKGTAWLNGSAIPGSSPIFSGDMVQTKSDSAANINAVGSAIVISPNSLVLFEGARVGLEAGSVNVATSKALAVHVEGVTVTPASAAWTQFDISQTEDGVLIIARKGAVTLSDDSGTSTLAEGQQIVWKNPEKKRRKGGTPVAATAGPLSSRWVAAGGAAVAGIILVFALDPTPEPISPWKP